MSPFLASSWPSLLFACLFHSLAYLTRPMLPLYLISLKRSIYSLSLFFLFFFHFIPLHYTFLIFFPISLFPFVYENRFCLSPFSLFLSFRLFFLIFNFLYSPIILTRHFFLSFFSLFPPFFFLCFPTSAVSLLSSLHLLLSHTSLPLSVFLINLSPYFSYIFSLLLFPAPFHTHFLFFFTLPRSSLTFFIFFSLIDLYFIFSAPEAPFLVRCLFIVHSIVSSCFDINAEQIKWSGLVINNS